jgi:REP element-mobilizing transposase RayT
VAYREFRLRPSEETNGIILYALALAAQRSGVVLHSVCVMSDHVHVVLTDVRGEHPRFSHLFDLFVSKAMNAAQGRREAFWASGPPSVAQLATPEAVLDKVAYTAVNPVKAGLVETPQEWPGVNLWKPERRMVKRPDAYFDPRGKLPSEVELVIDPPPPGMQVPNWDRRLEQEIGNRITAARRAMKALGLRFLGRAGVLATAFEERAKSNEQMGRIVPQVVAVVPRARVERLRALRRFQGEYAAALHAWRAGDRSVVFPPGTWWMRVHHGARIAALPAAA